MGAEKELKNLLEKHSLSLSVAESCTGGLIAARLTMLSGISAFFKGGIIAYSNSVKTEILGVSKEMLDTRGAVSEEVVEVMAKNVSELIGTECAISVSGIAGPGGGSEKKPVGLVYIGSNVSGDVESKKYLFDGNREEIRKESTEAALEQLCHHIRRIKGS